MNWSKIKNIMIFILVAVNLFLIVDISVTRYYSLALPEGTGENFKTVLERNGISLEDYLVPKYYETRTAIDAQFYNIDYLTKIFFNKQVNYISNGQEVVAASDGKKLTISGISFEYTKEGTPKAKNGADILRALKKTGLSTKGAEFVKDEGLVRVFIDGCVVEGIYLDVTLNENGEIIYLKGVWPNVFVTHGSEKVSVISCVNSICETLPAGSRIDSVEKVYITKSDGRTCDIVPGWKIYCGGKSYTIG